MVDRAVPFRDGADDTRASEASHGVEGTEQTEARPLRFPLLNSNHSAPPKSTVFLTSNRHKEKLPEVTGTSQGNPGFPAATLERHRESFFMGKG